MSIKGTKIMMAVNATTDSFWAPSRITAASLMERMEEYALAGVDILDIGAVSTRPGAAGVTVEEEWSRLKPVLENLVPQGNRHSLTLSVDTTSSTVVRRTFDLLGHFIVNDISAGEDDPQMLRTVGQLGLGYVAMHKRGTPSTMDSLCDYPDSVMTELHRYFNEFSSRAAAEGISDWILDPGFGFAKTMEQNMEILDRLGELKCFSRPVLAAVADKRFTQGRTEELQKKAVENGADMLRVHRIPTL